MFYYFTVGVIDVSQLCGKPGGGQPALQINCIQSEAPRELLISNIFCYASSSTLDTWPISWQTFCSFLSCIRYKVLQLMTQIMIIFTYVYIFNVCMCSNIKKTFVYIYACEYTD